MEVALERKDNFNISQSFASDRRRFEEIAEKLDAVRDRAALTLALPTPLASCGSLSSL